MDINKINHKELDNLIKDIDADNSINKPKKASKPAKSSKSKKAKSKIAANEPATASATTPASATPAGTTCITTPEMINEQKEKIKKETEEMIKTSLSIANKLFEEVKNQVKNNEEFMKMKDHDKVEYFRKVLKYDDFISRDPVIARYAICLGRFSSYCYERMLVKWSKIIPKAPDKREKGYMEDQFIRKQADYVRYLWEEEQTGHYDNKQAKEVWRQTYEKLKGEFDDFRDTHKEVEERVKTEQTEFNGVNALELLERLKTGKQTLPEQDQKDLLELLRYRVELRKHKNMNDEFLQMVSRYNLLIEPKCESIGKGAQDRPMPDQPVLQMNVISQDKEDEPSAAEARAS